MPEELRLQPIPSEPEEQSCPECWIPRRDWKSRGVERDGETFCCRGCAEGTGCTCSVIE